MPCLKLIYFHKFGSGISHSVDQNQFPSSTRSSTFSTFFFSVSLLAKIGSVDGFFGAAISLNYKTVFSENISIFRRYLKFQKEFKWNIQSRKIAQNLSVKQNLCVLLEFVLEIEISSKKYLDPRFFGDISGSGQNSRRSYRVDLQLQV